MVKIFFATWHGCYSMIRRAEVQIDRRIDLALYSGKLLEDGIQTLTDCLEAVATADLVVYYVTESFSMWGEILEYAKKERKKILYVGDNAVACITDYDDLEKTSICNQYTTYGGVDNYGQLIQYLASLIDESIVCKKPCSLPWEGIYHPDFPTLLTNVADYFAGRPPMEKGVIGLLFSRSSWVNGNLLLEDMIIRLIEKSGYTVLPVFTYSKADPEIGSKGAAAAVEEFFLDDQVHCRIDVLIKMQGSFLVGRSEMGTENKPKSVELLNRLNCPVIHPICLSGMTIEEWENDPFGSLKDVGWSIALPEMEGVIEPIVIGAVNRDREEEQTDPIQERCEKLVERVIQWTKLAKKPNREKKVVFILNNFPCASVEASVGGGANLDTLESVAKVMQRLCAAGYDLEHVPENGKELIDQIMSRKAISEFRWTTVKEIVQKGGALAFISKDTYLPWFEALPQQTQQKMIESWGKPIGEEIDGVPAAMIYEDKIVITGISFKHALVCAQPKRGCAGARCDGTVCKILHDPSVPPTHQYVATYQYFAKEYQADVLINVGTHGNMEFLPGRGTGLSAGCYPDICVGTMPFLYIYNADNPPEGIIAKRRGLATLVDHMQTVFTSSGLYDRLEELNTLLERYEKLKVSDLTQAHLLEHLIKEEIERCNLDTQINLADYHENFAQIVEKAHELLTVIKNTMIQDGQHVFGQIPQGQARLEFLNAIVRYEGLEQRSLRSCLSHLFGLDFQELLQKGEKFWPEFGKSSGSILFDLDTINKQIIQCFIEGREITAEMDIFLGYPLKNPETIAVINRHQERIADINNRVEDSLEIEALLRAMDGGFIEPGPAGVVTRGRDDVLPTGRNFYTIDPETVPSKAAWEIGRRLGDQVIEKYLQDEGRYPESIGYWWMCYDVMWAEGEGLAQMLYLLGAKPKWLPNGRVRGFEVLSLAEINRPRIDLTIKISGILRDNFRECMDILDDAIRTVAALDEPLEQNYVRKHTLAALQEQEGETAWEDAASRLFGNKPGAYGSGINLMVYASAWKEKKDFVDIYTFFTGYSYGRDREGVPAFKQLQNNLKNMDVTYNKVISDESDLLGCCGYFSNQGGMTVAARELSGREVKAYYGDTREVTNVEIRTLADEIRRVVRTKLLNPKWIEGQKRHGYKGAGDINKRVGRVFGWDATTDEVDNWIFDDITKTFILNAENRQFFQENNPWALEEIARRMLEANQRDLWQAEDGLIEELKETYLEIEGWLEESMGDDVGEFQGSAIDIVDLEEIKLLQQNMHKMKEILK